MNAKAEKLNSLVVRLRLEYAHDPNVQHVSWGIPRRQGKLKNETAIIFHVKEKFRSQKQMESRGTAPLPRTIEGFPTDVQTQKNVQAANGLLETRDRLADPLNGGWLTATYSGHTFWYGSDGGGTLGILCRDNATGDTMALSNWHVWADGFEFGDNILQPSTPTTAEYVEGTTKVLACGPLVTSLIEWEWPDPLTAGLYGGAAAAAVAAALSDHRDPTRRGQDATPTDPHEKTLSEVVKVEVDYPDLPFPGRPFRNKVAWGYSRETNLKTHEHHVEETLVNPQFLLGKRVTSDRNTYEPGSTMSLRVVIWDYQPRPCDAYFVVAHIIPENHSTVAHRVVLHPTECDQSDTDPTTDRTCIDFGAYNTGQTFPSSHTFEWLMVHSLDNENLRIVDWYSGSGHAGRGELSLPEAGLVFTHAPATQVSLEVVHFHSSPIVITGYDAAGNVVGSTTSSGTQGQVETLTLEAPNIARTIVRGGGNEGVILQYCIVENRLDQPVVEVSEELAWLLHRSRVPTLDNRAETRITVQRCCFSATFRVPPISDPGRWNIYLFVQNVNHVPRGTEPDVAATTIGGHVLSAGVPNILTCAGIMLADHVFDVI